jgi:hypothetical protein
LRALDVFQHGSDKVSRSKVKFLGSFNDGLNSGGDFGWYIYLVYSVCLNAHNIQGEFIVVKASFNVYLARVEVPGLKRQVTSF